MGDSGFMSGLGEQFLSLSAQPDRKNSKINLLQYRRENKVSAAYNREIVHDKFFVSGGLTMSAKLPLADCFDRKLWPPSALKLRVEHYFELPRGGTIGSKLSKVNEDLAWERDYSALIKTEAERRTYEEHVGSLLRAAATYRKMSETVIEDALKQGSAVALGYTAPETPQVVVPPSHWHFLTMDYDRELAASPAHGLSFYGLLIGDRRDVQRAISKLAQKLRREPDRTPFSHAPDYSEVWLDGSRFQFRGLKQRTVIKLLHEAQLRGDVWLYGIDLLDAVNSNDDSRRLANLFRGNPAWGRLIISDRKGRYRIASE